MGQKLGGVGVPFFLGVAGSPVEHKVAWAEAYLHPKWHRSPSSRLATDIGRKLGRGCDPLGEGQLGPCVAQCRLGRGLPPYEVAS